MTTPASQPRTSAPADLTGSVTAVSAHRPLLVATDMDGVLAPFDDDPLAVEPSPASLAALRALAAVDGVHVAVVSGRDLATLRTLTGIGEDEPITLIGSHGSESSVPLGESGLDEDELALLDRLRGDIESVVEAHPPTRIEYKPASIGLHVRGLPEDLQDRALAAGAEAAQQHDGITVIPGKGVMEAGVLKADKGTALLALARTLDADAAVYFGDDVTDEHAFTALPSLAHSLTVKVGDGDTAATARIADEDAVAVVLGMFVEAVGG